MAISIFLLFQKCVVIIKYVTKFTETFLAAVITLIIYSRDGLKMWCETVFLFDLIDLKELYCWVQWCLRIFKEKTEHNKKNIKKTNTKFPLREWYLSCFFLIWVTWVTKFLSVILRSYIGFPVWSKHLIAKS